MELSGLNEAIQGLGDKCLTLSINFILESVKIYKTYAEKHVNQSVPELDSGLR